MTSMIRKPLFNEGGEERTWEFATEDDEEDEDEDDEELEDDELDLDFTPFFASPFVTRVMFKCYDTTYMLIPRWGLAI